MRVRILQKIQNFVNIMSESHVNPTAKLLQTRAKQESGQVRIESLQGCETVGAAERISFKVVTEFFGKL